MELVRSESNKNKQCPKEAISYAPGGPDVEADSLTPAGRGLSRSRTLAASANGERRESASSADGLPITNLAPATRDLLTRRGGDPGRHCNRYFNRLRSPRLVSLCSASCLTLTA